MKKIYVLMLLLLAFSLLSVGSVAAQGGGPESISDDEVNAIAKELFCPVCENTPLDVCETQACKQWRELIRLQLSEGATEAEIKQYFVDNYGARVLSEPPRTGFNLLAYFVPPAIILIGVVVLFRAFRQWQREDEAEVDDEITEADSTSTSDDDDYIARFEAEMKKRD